MMQSKTILITGATSGIGLALAKKCIELGNKVIITGRDQQKLNAVAKELKVEAYLAHSADLSQLIELGKTLTQQGTLLDGVVLNAGVFYPSTFESMTPENFDETIAINTKGPLFTLQYLLPCLRNPASVVFISSIVVYKGFAGCSAYAASKGALESTTRVLNVELADRGIRINTIRPGITATEIHSKAGMTDEQQKGTFDSLKTTPLGRALTVDDHLGAIIYLLNDASLALRNASIDIEGGFTL